jgi:NADH-quinone oxidoreductase subunit L
MTHAFFKACLFLASGSVIHGMHHLIHDEVGSQDMRNMGGLRAVMPKTAWCYKMACIAITAAPPGFAGFWSKDEILWKMYNQNGYFVPGWLIYGIGLSAALGTSFYMWRSYYLTFEGKHAHKEIPKKVHESPAAMVVVLQILAVLSIVSGVLFGLSSHILGGALSGLLPGEPLLEQWLHPVLAHSSAVIPDAGLKTELLLMAVSVSGAAAAWSIAKARYGADRPADWEAIEKKLPGFTLMQNKYYVDEIYAFLIVNPIKAFARFCWRWVDDGLIDGVLVNGPAAIVNLTGRVVRLFTTGDVQRYAFFVLGGVWLLVVVWLAE